MKRRISCLFFVLLQLPVFALPCQAEVTWHDVAGSLNSSFKGDQAFSIKSGITLLVIIIMILVALLLIHLWTKKEKQQSKERNQISWRPLGRQQKRKWFRLKTSEEFEWIPADEAYTVKKSHYKKDRLVDISGGGLCFATAEKLNSGDQLVFLLDTGGEKALTLTGTVLRIEEDADRGSSINKVSVQFGDIRSGERDRIVSYIMDRQRVNIHEKKKESLLPKSQI